MRWVDVKVKSNTHLTRILISHAPENIFCIQFGGWIAPIKTKLSHLRMLLYLQKCPRNEESREVGRCKAKKQYPLTGFIISHAPENIFRIRFGGSIALVKTKLSHTRMLLFVQN